MIVYGVFLQGGSTSSANSRHSLANVFSWFTSANISAALTQGSHGKEIGRHQKLKRGGIVGRTESRGYQPYRLHRIAPSVIGHGVERTLRLALEVIGAVPLSLRCCSRNVCRMYATACSHSSEKTLASPVAFQ